MASHARPRSRICLTGPESTGKTTLARRLAAELGCACVDEYAREYAIPRGNDLSAADVEPIARGQMAGEDRVADPACDLILDTDLISTVVYARHYYGFCPAWIEDEARRRRADLYLLMDTDVPWIPDPARDSGGEARQHLLAAFRAALDEFGVRWIVISGDWEERQAIARAAVKA